MKLGLPWLELLAKTQVGGDQPAGLLSDTAASQFWRHA